MNRHTVFWIHNTQLRNKEGKIDRNLQINLKTVKMCLCVQLQDTT